ncbi:hypothetical protein Tco_1567278 [Tanacetum coccineum]
MLTTRGNGKIIKEETLVSNRTRGIKQLGHTMLDQMARKDTLGLYHTATSENFTTLDLAPFNVETARRSCGAKGYFKNDCLKLRNQNGGRAHGRAFVLRGGEARQDPKVVTGMFLLNNRYAYDLFDTGADKSFVSTAFSPFINITPTTLDTKYTTELADGKLIGADP